MDFQVSRCKLCVLLLASLLTISILYSVQVYASPGSVTWYAEDTTTKGNWLTAAGSPSAINADGLGYGTYAHILPNAPINETQVSIGSFSTPVGFDLGNSSTWSLLNTTNCFNWTLNQVAGLSFYKPDPPYYDEYVTKSPPVTYHVNGTQNPPSLNSTKYPVFEWAWAGWHSTQTEPREVYYTTSIPDTGNGPGWRLVCWDDGGERCKPPHGYINVTLHFPQGSYLLSLYAYDYERDVRYSQVYRVYDEAGALLASKQIIGSAFDEGVYEIFRVFAPPSGLTIIVQVYNDAGHVFPHVLYDSINVLLSGIFVDQLLPTGGFLFPIKTFELPAPWIELSLIIIVPSALMAYIWLRKKRQT